MERPDLSGRVRRLARSRGASATRLANLVCLLGEHSAESHQSVDGKLGTVARAAPNEQIPVGSAQPLNGFRVGAFKRLGRAA